tara:strand:+ start:266 stop:823 length:558 start_codon:yes stop_codon:yes gene_type:complete
MNNESYLNKLLHEKPNSKEILLLAKELESESKFKLSRDIENLKGIWELRWSSSNAPFLSYSRFIDNLQILNPSKSSAINLLKPRSIKTLIGTGIIAKLNPMNDIRIGVKFIYAGLIGPKIGNTKLKVLTEIKKDQIGWLDITYLSNKLRICRGDKGTIFVLKKREDEKLFIKCEELIDKFSMTYQ